MLVRRSDFRRGGGGRSGAKEASLNCGKAFFVRLALFFGPFYAARFSARTTVDKAKRSFAAIPRREEPFPEAAGA